MSPQNAHQKDEHNQRLQKGTTEAEKQGFMSCCPWHILRTVQRCRLPLWPIQIFILYSISASFSDVTPCGFIDHHQRFGGKCCLCLPDRTYLLTYSMVQSPSWEANWFAASQEIPSISRNPKLPHSQASATCPYPGPAQSSPYTHIPPPGDTS